MLLKKTFISHAPAAVILIRLMVGAVFLSEGIQKFMFPAALGPGRFLKLGFALPTATAYFVACFEVACGALFILGLFTRLAAVPTTIIMLVAIAKTKAPMLATEGFWKTAHEGRADWSMLIGSLFLLIVGGGAWALDRFLAARPMPPPPHQTEPGGP